MSGEEKKTHWFRRGVVIGALAGTVFLLTNKNARNKVTNCVSRCKATTERWITVIKDNQDSFIEQLKTSTDKISSIVEQASEDIEKLVESSQNVKDHTIEMIKTIQEAKEQFQTLTTKLKEEQTLLEDDILPATNDDTEK